MHKLRLFELLIVMNAAVMATVGRRSEINQTITDIWVYRNIKRRKFDNIANSNPAGLIQLGFMC